jgi:hypothetical protein
MRAGAFAPRLGDATSVTGQLDVPRDLSRHMGRACVGCGDSRAEGLEPPTYGFGVERG